METGSSPPSYVFIPGKNWKLSLAELLAFFKARNYELKITNLTKSFFIFDIKPPIEPAFIDYLGGTIKIGRVISRFPSEILKDAFLHKKSDAQAEIRQLLSNMIIREINATTSKCVFGISLYFGDAHFLHHSKTIHRFIGSQLKKELRANDIQAGFMGFPKNRKLPQLTHVEVLKKDLIEKSAEILVCIDRKQVLIAKTVSVHNPFEFQKRDIERPFQRKIFSIPPRLAKIMVNLSFCLPGAVFLDPFCGVGTILQEALLAEARVIGIDINSWCVKASCGNLGWLKNEYNLKNATYEALLADSRNLTKCIEEKTIDCLATEPDLGPALRYVPTKRFAEKIVEQVKPLYTGFLEEAHKVLKEDGRLVVVVPHIKTRSGAFVSLSVEGIARRIGFTTIHPFEKKYFIFDTSLTEELANTLCLVDMERKHKVGREIYVFKK